MENPFYGVGNNDNTNNNDEANEGQSSGPCFYGDFSPDNVDRSNINIWSSDQEILTAVFVSYAAHLKKLNLDVALIREFDTKTVEDLKDIIERVRGDMRIDFIKGHCDRIDLKLSMSRRIDLLMYCYPLEMAEEIMNAMLLDLISRTKAA
jgi:hypothetical protein